MRYSNKEENALFRGVKSTVIIPNGNISAG